MSVSPDNTGRARFDMADIVRLHRAELEPVEFLRRFVQHVLPDGFHKIRHYGLYSASLAAKREQARKRLSPDQPQAPAEIPPAFGTSDSWVDRLRELTGRDVSRCPACDAGLVRRPVPNQQAPPSARAA